MRQTNFFEGIALVAATVCFSLALCFAILAWTEPGATPPGGNVASPINTGNVAQTKTGDLTVTTKLTSSDEICFGASCRTKWTGDTCPAGQYMVGIKDNGDIKCETR